MKKKTFIILSICLVLVIGLTISSFAVVEATGEENVYEALKSIVTGNTNRIEKLENEVDTLENEINTLKGQITELQKQNETEKEETEDKDTTNNSNKKPTTNTTSTKKPNTTTTSSNTTNNSSTTTTTDYQKQIDTLNKEIETLKLNKKDLIGSWNIGNPDYTLTFNDNNTATNIEVRKNTTTSSGTIDGIYTTTSTTTKVKYVCNYTYTIEGNYIHLTLVNATNQELGGTKTITTKNVSTGEETTETVEIKAEEPVNNPNAYKNIIYNGTVINNSLYLSSAVGKLVKSN